MLFVLWSRGVGFGLGVNCYIWGWALDLDIRPLALDLDRWTCALLYPTAAAQSAVLYCITLCLLLVAWCCCSMLLHSIHIRALEIGRACLRMSRALCVCVLCLAPSVLVSNIVPLATSY